MGQALEKVFDRPKSMYETPFLYCPGCGHSIVHRLVAEVMDELDITDKAVGITSAGCSVRNWRQFDCDMVMSLHGRGPAVATGLKRVRPEVTVFTYQGDGDMAAIGTGEIIHAASRCERITVIYVNNGVFGATGGQQAPTTLVGQSSTTTPGGRDMSRDGGPLDLSEILALTSGSVYIERTAVNSPKNVRQTKKAITKAFKSQMANQGFSLVEILSPCPTNWKMSPVDSHRWIDEAATSVFPLKVIKDETEES